MTATQDTQIGFDPGDWEEFLTVPEVAQILRISKMTVYRMIHRGAFALSRDDPGAIQVGRSFRVRSAAVAKVVREGTPA